MVSANCERLEPTVRVVLDVEPVLKVLTMKPPDRVGKTAPEPTYTSPKFVPLVQLGVTLYVTAWATCSSRMSSARSDVADTSEALTPLPYC